MTPVQLSDILSIADYEALRSAQRPHVLGLKERRRIRVGEHLTFLFENRDTVRYQVQEMMRIERIAESAAIAHELETYNELIPAAGELSASLLIEYETPAERDVHLRQLMGLDQHIWLDVAGERTQAVFDNRQIGDDRISSVQYVKFPVTATQQAAWAGGATLVADHRYYSVERVLTAAERTELAGDFA
jgi:hypothetical protein